MKKISIVIPTYNHLEDCLKPCLESVIAYTDLDNAEVIIVANGCTDGTRQYVDSLGEKFMLLWHEEKLGYTKSTNIGLQAATGEYIVLLNNDVILLGQNKNMWIARLQQPFADEKVGLTGIYKTYSPEVNCDFFNFFCVMTKKAILDQLGLLDEIFSPGLVEDIDYCKRIDLAGYKLVDCGGFTSASGYIWSKEFLFGGDFPIFHPSSSTFHDAEHNEQYKELRQRNLLLLANKYKIL